MSNGHRILPGSAQAKPFRSLNNVRDGNNSILDTVLRQLPNQPARGRRLWELNGSSSGGPAHYAIQDQLLARLMDNTTTRSNVFIVFMSVTFFEAHTWTGSDNAGQTRNDQVPVVQIAGRFDFDDTDGKTPKVFEPDHRGLFIVDRSRLEAAKRRNGSIDWRKLVLYRHKIKELK